MTGAFAGAAVWLFFLRWSTVSTIYGPRFRTRWASLRPELASGPFGFLPYPFFVCLLGGLLIGLYEKMTGTKTDDLNQVMAGLSKTGATRTTTWGKAFARGIAAAAVWRKHWTGRPA